MSNKLKEKPRSMSMYVKWEYNYMIVIDYRRNWVEVGLHQVEE